MRVGKLELTERELEELRRTLSLPIFRGWAVDQDVLHKVETALRKLPRGKS